MSLSAFGIFSTIEKIVDGTALHQILLNCPLSSFAQLYRRTGGMVTALLCFQWIGMFLFTLPVPRTGLIGWLFKGGLMGVVLAEYLVLDYILSNFIGSVSVTKGWLVIPLSITCALGLVVLYLDPVLKFSPIKTEKMKERAKIYKEQATLSMRFCSQCEQFQVFRSQHNVMDGKCVARFEFHSYVLNCSIGARNILPMFFFNFAFMVYHYQLLVVATEVVDLPTFKDIPPFLLLLASIVIFYGLLHTFKETVICLISVLSGTSVGERGSAGNTSYFKSKSGMVNPFDKGIRVHILEAIYAMIGYDPAADFDVLDTNAMIDDEETKKATEADEVFSRFLNPYATRLPTNWQYMDIMTMFEIDSEMREIMVRALKKVLDRKKKGKGSDSSENSDDDMFAISNKTQQSNGNSGCGSGKCGHGHSHGNPNSHHNHNHRQGGPQLMQNQGAPQSLDTSSSTLPTFDI